MHLNIKLINFFRLQGCPLKWKHISLHNFTSHINLEKEDLDQNEELDPYQERTVTGPNEDLGNELKLSFFTLPGILNENPCLGEPST